MERYKAQNVAGLNQASQVLTLLRQVVSKNRLSAVAVECFSLVQQRKVTACLALAQLNTEGVVAACEGDLASMAGMMLLGAFAGSVPWMANTTRITSKSLFLSHCTVPYNMVSDVSLPTHYETDCSLAVKGTMLANEVTLFRLSGPLDKAFVAEGVVIARPDLSQCLSHSGGDSFAREGASPASEPASWKSSGDGARPPGRCFNTGCLPLPGYQNNRIIKYVIWPKKNFPDVAGLRITR